MQPPSTLLLSTGEFARMCNVSKELLIHYDKVGLLKPKVIGKNGYRYYSLKQLYLMDAIRFFLDTGMSMKEVRPISITVPPTSSSRPRRRASRR